MGAGGGGCGMVGSAGFDVDETASSGCVTLCVLKHANEQLSMLVSLS